MSRLYSDRILWAGLHGKADSAICDVEIFEDLREDADNEFIVILTEPADNPGCSVTNGAELLATKILRDFEAFHAGRLHFGNTQFIEHYLEHPSAAGGWETFDTVAFRYDEKLKECRSPAWARVSWDRVAKAIGFEGKKWSEI